ncbi:MAG: restriction endonuclease subunit S [Fusobacteriaceae bacterium]
MKNKVPKLRFSKFSEDWKEKKLREISILKGGFAFKSDNFLSEKSIYQVIKMGNIYQNNLLLNKNPSYLSKVTEKQKEYTLKNGDTIITLTGTVGKRDFGYSFQITNETNLLLNQRLALFRVDSNKIDYRFLRYILLKDEFLNQFFESSTGGVGNQANVSIKNMEV